MRPARSVFVIHPGALGDVLLSLQALTVLRRHHPTHHLVLVARSDIGILLERGGVVDQTYPVESGVLASLFAGPEYVDPPLQRLLRSCDHAVAWLDDADHSLQHTFRSLGVGRMTLEAPKPRAGVHQSLRILQTVTEDLPSDASACPLYVDESSRDAAGETLRRMAAGA